MKTKYDQYWYFRGVTDEIADDTGAGSVMVALDQITSIIPTSTTAIKIYFRQATTDALQASQTVGGLNGSVSLNVTAGKSESIMRALVADINAGPRNKPHGVTTIADDTTIDFDDTVRNPIYIHPGITSCGAIMAR